MQISSWEPVGDWYDKTVGAKGHYYHERVVLPNGLRLLELAPTSRLLDLACGQGILARHIHAKTAYVGIDAAPALIRAAKQYQPKENHQFLVGDVTEKLSIEERNFTHAAIILALQNIADPLAVLKNAHAHLQSGGKLLIVLNHPCFRIPRQSSWGVDTPKKIQYRRIDRYMSPMKIPIQMHPGQGNTSAETCSFHHPLSDYCAWLKQAGFIVENIEEWCSDKKSTGQAARMEDRSRKEFPLFLALLASK